MARGDGDLHTTTFLPWSSRAGMALGDGDAGGVGPSMRGDGDARGVGRRERGQVLHTTPFLPWSSRAGMARGDGDAGGVGESGGVGDAESGGEREREQATVGRTVHENVCTSTLSSYRVVEIYIYILVRCTCVTTA
jgi:hypothetical protein